MSCCQIGELEHIGTKTMQQITNRPMLTFQRKNRSKAELGQNDFNHSIFMCVGGPVNLVRVMLQTKCGIKAKCHHVDEKS